jgi:hypothetical protein
MSSPSNKHAALAPLSLAGRLLGIGALASLAFQVSAFEATAQIESLTLEQMVAKTDNSVLGEITKKEVIRIDHPIDGPELYYTHLTVEGRSLVDGKQLTAVVTYPGGFIDAENGVWNSEAPSDEDAKIGNQVVVFYKHSENMGGDLEADALYASHGGLFRTANGRNGTVVLGRGEGYAVRDNTLLETLDERVTEIRQAVPVEGK